MLPMRAVEVEEIALGAVRFLVLEEKDEIAVVEGLEPVVPTDLLEAIVAFRVEDEAQDAGVVVMLRAGNGRGNAAARLGPMLDHAMVAGRQRLAGSIFLFVAVNP